MSVETAMFSAAEVRSLCLPGPVRLADGAGAVLAGHAVDARPIALSELLLAAVRSTVVQHKQVVLLDVWVDKRFCRCPTCRAALLLFSNSRRSAPGSVWWLGMLGWVPRFRLGRACLCAARRLC